MLTSCAAPADAGLWCAIPTYQNAGTVRGVAERARAQVARVVVVDDGSTDGDVRELLRGLDVEVLRHDRNRGKGRAILTALAHVKARGGAYVVTVDADGQHFPEDIPAFAAAVREHDPCVVLGDRDFYSAAVPRSSRFGRAFSNLWVRIETGEALPDTQCGMRAYPVDPLARLPLGGSRYDFEIEVLARASWAGIPLRSVPVRVWYPESPAERRSSFRPWVDNLRLTRMHTRLVARQLLPWPHRRLLPRPPRTSLFRSPRAWMREQLSQHATPGGLAASAAVGVFLGVLPLIGAHIVAIAYVTSRLRLNKVMALAIQNLCMPPFVPVACIEVGHLLLRGRWLVEASWDNAVVELPSRLLEWLVGSLVLAPLLAGLAAGATYLLARLASNLRRPRSPSQ